MEYVEEVFAEGGGRDDEEQSTAIAAEGLGVNKSVVVHGDEAVAKRWVQVKDSGKMWEGLDLRLV